jgi:hypothetical protein
MLHRAYLEAPPPDPVPAYVEAPPDPVTSGTISDGPISDGPAGGS